MAAHSTILVVDDDRDIAELLRELLSDEGYKVRVAPNGTAALEAIRAQAPDLILLDLQLPGMSGFEVLQAAFGDGLPTMPVIVMTASGPLEVREKVGAVYAYVFKPFDIENLLAIIAGCMRADRTREAFAADEVQGD